MRSGRTPTSSDCSATRAERFAERTEENVATARTSVPPAVASEEIVAQSAIARASIDARYTATHAGRDRHRSRGAVGAPGSLRRREGAAARAARRDPRSRGAGPGGGGGGRAANG